ncbi:MAG: ComEC/Rec2 family competence protein [Planctomycetota bacterium]|nr:ComEC/Rec2 family competence protein [Planctomycetota bacterium]
MDGPKPARRAAYAAAFLSLGIVLARIAPAWGVGTVVPAALLGLAAALALAASIFRHAPARACLPLAVVALGAGLCLHRTAHVPDHHIARCADPGGTLLRVSGLIEQSPRTQFVRAGRLGRFLPSEPLTRFVLRVDEVQAGGPPRPASGRLWVRLNGISDLPAGQRVRMTGVVRSLRPPSNPGDTFTPARALARGFGGTIDVDSPDAIEPLPIDSPLTRLRAHLHRISARLHAGASAWLQSPADAPVDPGADEPRALLAALLLGEDDMAASELRDAFTRLGLSHILSISGLNLALLAGAVLFALRLAGDRPRAEALLASLAVLVYLLIVPARAPVLRAGFMTWALLAAEATGRRYDRLTILSWAACIILIWNPTELFSPGFQLSVGVVAALLTLAHPLRRRLFGLAPDPDQVRPPLRLLHTLQDAVAAAIVAWAVSAPLVAYHVGVVSPLGALATVALMPIVGLIMAAGYLVLLVALVVPPAGRLAAPALESLAWILARCVRTLDGFPGSVIHLPSLSLAWTIAATALIIWWLWPQSIEGPTPRTRRARWTATALVVLWLAARLLFTGPPQSQALRLDTLDVADGTCHLLRLRDPATGRTAAALIDCGSLRLTVGERTIPRAVRALGAWRVPTVVLSHPNIDHYAGLLDFIAPLGVRRVILTEAFDLAARAAPTGPVAYLLEQLEARGVEVVRIAAGATIDLAPNLRAEVLWPPRGLRVRRDNDASLVLRFTAAGRTLMTTGDIQDEAIASILADRPDLRADILEAPHHGSPTPATERFVLAVDPRVVVQSTGPRRLDDPRLARARADREWLATPRHGAITVIVERDGSITARGFRTGP